MQSVSDVCVCVCVYTGLLSAECIRCVCVCVCIYTGLLSAECIRCVCVCVCVYTGPLSAECIRCVCVCVCVYRGLLTGAGRRLLLRPAPCALRPAPCALRPAGVRVCAPPAEVQVQCRAALTDADAAAPPAYRRASWAVRGSPDEPPKCCTRMAESNQHHRSLGRCKNSEQLYYKPPQGLSSPSREGAPVHAGTAFILSSRGAGREA